ncbi:putative E3 ubiquitin-protein ligase UBR7 isoform X1 [Cucurbita moschata]|uniref:E3 ubiquitin-protein ligase UBR7 isoform X1 n=1 Tax=Cucurbita moschata TaxID=3662 RepID=A0A6J1H2D9_CUCMO|nr:putative E3 ubiquitin-protein ligase UBR7 isoform X1 [Cucurbita moschata]
MAEVFDDETEQTISIQEYLKEVEEQELEADLVLGGDEGKECTYSKGYLKRQAIFSCLTCTPDGNAGVCTACSLSCHDGHEIVELWTKRNFRCDCGNSNFGDFICKLFSNKDVENANNSYNHNFKGSYCICNRPYPDPDVEEQVEMIQCCMCEDWFHEEHLGLSSIDEFLLQIPRDEDGEPLYEDFICSTCSAVCSFLSQYPSSIWAVGRPSDISLDVTMKNDAPEPILSLSTSVKHDDDTNAHDSANVDLSVAPDKSADKNSLLTEPTTENDRSSNESIKDNGQTVSCVLGASQSSASIAVQNKPMFLSKNWRGALCRCEKCVDNFKRMNISFLLDEEDSIAEYEKIAKQKREEKLQQQEGAELKLFDNLGHVEKIEILNGIADMKDEIHTFLESFDSSKPITSADIHQVFENLAKKRRRTE